jgi:hypothetical protein
MKKLLITAALFLVLPPAFALPGDRASFHISFSTPPTLAVIQPGVQVVVDHDEEVFYADHHYWVHRGGDWYRASHHSHAFAYVEQQRVPGALRTIELGHFRRYHPAGSHGGHGGPAGDHGDHAGQGGDDGYSDDGYDHDHGHGGQHGGGHAHGC